MLKDIIILRKTDIIYWKENIDPISWEVLTPNLTTLYIYINDCTEDGLYQTKFEYFKISYIYSKNLNLIFIFTNDLDDDDSVIDQLLKYVREQFLNTFSPEIINTADDTEVFEPFFNVTKLVHTYFKPIIALLGFNSVGKTTIANLLTENPETTQKIPETNKAIHEIKVRGLDFEMWDFTGEEKLLFQWPKYLKNSNFALLITDSTPQNVEKSFKFFNDLINKNFPNLKLGIIGNKQDIENSLSGKEISKMINFEQVYELTSIEPTSSEFLSIIIQGWLNVQNQVSPRLTLTLDRKKMIKLVEELINVGNDEQALEYCKVIVDYSRKLKEHDIVQDFLDKIHKLTIKIENKRQDNLMHEVVEKIRTPSVKASIIPTLEERNPHTKDMSVIIEIENLQINIDSWKNQLISIEEKIKELDIKLRAFKIQESEYDHQKELLNREKMEIQEKLHDAKLQMINLI